MSNASTIKAVTEQAARSYAANPETAVAGGRTRVRSLNGLTCEIADGPWRLRADLPVRAGGGNEGPNPGVYIRSALGACLTIDIVTWAARFEVPLTAVEVEVESTLDARGMYGIDDEVPAGYQGLKVSIRVESPAPEAEVRRVISTVEARNPRLYDLTHAIPVEREVTLVRPSSATVDGEQVRLGA